MKVYVYVYCVYVHVRDYHPLLSVRYIRVCAREHERVLYVNEMYAK